MACAYGRGAAQGASWNRLLFRSGPRGGGTRHCVKMRRDWKAAVVRMNSSLWKNATPRGEPGTLDRCVTLRLHANLRYAPRLLTPEQPNHCVISRLLAAAA